MQERFPQVPFSQSEISQERWRELGDLVNALFATQPLEPGQLPRPEYNQVQKRSLPAGAPRILGVAGKPQAGKDVVADYLEFHYQGVQRINFSDPISLEVNQWLEPSGHQITQGNKSQTPYRSLLQTWGLARREENPYYWTELLEVQIQSMLQGGLQMVVVCGVRAESDLELVEKLGGKCWQIVRPGNTYQAEHPIESSLDGIEPGRMQVVLNPTEGDLTPYEQNIRQALEPE